MAASFQNASRFAIRYLHCTCVIGHGRRELRPSVRCYVNCYTLDPRPPPQPQHPRWRSNPSWSSLVKQWDASTGRMKASVDAHKKAVRRILYTPDQKSVVTASVDGKIRFWDPVTFKPQKTLEGPDEGVTCVAFSPDGAYLAASGTLGVGPWIRAPHARTSSTP